MASREVRPRARLLGVARGPALLVFFSWQMVNVLFLLEKSRGIYKLVGTWMEKSECHFCSECLMWGTLFPPPSDWNRPTLLTRTLRTQRIIRE